MKTNLKEKNKSKDNKSKMLRVRLSKDEYLKLKVMAQYFFNGNMSDLVRFASINFKKPR